MTERQAEQAEPATTVNKLRDEFSEKCFGD